MGVKQVHKFNTFLQIGSDRNSHGNLDLLEWYAIQNCNYAASHNGQLLIDYLDIHYYPQVFSPEISLKTQDGSSLSDDDSATQRASRFASLKSLYDPNFVDPSWIGGTSSDFLITSSLMIREHSPNDSIHEEHVESRLPGNENSDHRVELGK